MLVLHEVVTVPRQCQGDSFLNAVQTVATWQLGSVELRGKEEGKKRKK